MNTVNFRKNQPKSELSPQIFSSNNIGISGIFDIRYVVFNKKNNPSITKNPPNRLFSGVFAGNFPETFFQGVQCGSGNANKIGKGRLLDIKVGSGCSDMFAKKGNKNHNLVLTVENSMLNLGKSKCGRYIGSLTENSTSKVRKSQELSIIRKKFLNSAGNVGLIEMVEALKKQGQMEKREILLKKLVIIENRCKLLFKQQKRFFLIT